MNENLKNKVETVNELVEKLKRAKSVVFSGYQGISVKGDTELRTEMRKAENDYKVYKNRLIVRALKEIGIEGCDDMLQGCTSVGISYADECSSARIIAKAMKQNKQLEFKFGILDGRVIDKDEVVKISQLPSKEILVAKLLSVLNGPMTSLAIALKAIAEKKEQA